MGMTLADIEAILVKLRAQRDGISERISFYVDLRKQEFRKQAVDPYELCRGPARREHAYRLRQEGFTFAIIGERLGVCTNQARQMYEKYYYCDCPGLRQKLIKSFNSVSSGADRAHE